MQHENSKFLAVDKIVYNCLSLSDDGRPKLFHTHTVNARLPRFVRVRTQPAALVSVERRRPPAASDMKLTMLTRYWGQ